MKAVDRQHIVEEWHAQHGTTQVEEQRAHIIGLTAVTDSLTERLISYDQPMVLKTILASLRATTQELLKLFSVTSRLDVSLALLVRREKIQKHLNLLERQKTTLSLYVNAETYRSVEEVKMHLIPSFMRRRPKHAEIKPSTAHEAHFIYDSPKCEPDPTSRELIRHADTDLSLKELVHRTNTDLSLEEFIHHADTDLSLLSGEFYHPSELEAKEKVEIDSNSHSARRSKMSSAPGRIKRLSNRVSRNHNAAHIHELYGDLRSKAHELHEKHELQADPASPHDINSTTTLTNEAEQVHPYPSQAPDGTPQGRERFIVPTEEQRPGTSHASSGPSIGNSRPPQQPDTTQYVVTGASTRQVAATTQTGTHTATRALPLRCSISNNKTGDYGEMLIAFEENTTGVMGRAKIDDNACGVHGTKNLGDFRVLKEMFEVRERYLREKNRHQMLVTQRSQLVAARSRSELSH
ncbi:MAG: hypothetical protein Q9159_003407 [Coniocarpon cinnabarinum]